MENRKCSCCEKDSKRYMLLQNNITLCNNCVKNILISYDKFNSNESVNTINKTILKRPIEIKNALDEYVVGQERAKRILAIAIYNHYKRLELSDPDLEKSNILLVGPTGSGKTHMLRTAAKFLDVPFVSVDATSLTEAGYIGEDVDICLSKLLDKCDGDIKRAEKGIVFIDEIDKLSSYSTESEKKVGGTGVQQALLKLLEGYEVNVNLNKGGSPMFNGTASVCINTANILFICGGAFSDLENIINKRVNGTNGMGFNCNASPEKAINENILAKATVNDFKKFGMIPEFLGRLPIIATMDEISEIGLRQILTVPKNSLMQQYKKLFNYDEVELLFEDCALEEIAKKAFEMKTGARSLRSIMENILEDAMFEIPSNDNVGSVIITADVVKNHAKPIVKYRGEKCMVIENF